MAEEFHQGGVCGGNWWNSSRNLFGCSSPCSLASSDVAGSFSWNSPDMFAETTKHRSNDHGSVLPQNVHNPSMMGISSHGWNQDCLNRDGGRSDENYSDILREPGGLDSGMNYNQHQTCEGLSAAFPLNSSLLQTLFDTDQLEQTLSDNQGTNYPDQFLQVPPVFGKQQVTNHLPLGNKNPPLWNTQVGGNFLPSSPLDTNNYDHNSPNFNTKRQNEAGKIMGKNGSNEPTVKRPRIETPSPLPTFKVRKEKLGDRITALQQLVSPFGKTDTASVLHEAIEYIKFLHDQVSALCTPYLKNGSPQAIQPQQATDNDRQSHNIQDLKSGGLCLVPISSTYPVADAATDFWNPSFVGTFKL